MYHSGVMYHVSFFSRRYFNFDVFFGVGISILDVTQEWLLINSTAVISSSIFLKILYWNTGLQLTGLQVQSDINTWSDPHPIFRSTPSPINAYPHLNYQF